MLTGNKPAVPPRGVVGRPLTPGSPQGVVRSAPADLLDLFAAAGEAAAGHDYTTRKKLAAALTGLAEAVLIEPVAGAGGPIPVGLAADGDQDKVVAALLKNAVASQESDEEPEAEAGTPEKVRVGPLGVFALKALLHLLVEYAKRRRRSASAASPQTEEDES